MLKVLTQEDIEMVTHFAWQLVGVPYKLGGNVPQDGGMDCSAFALELLRALKLWNTSDATAQMIYDKLSKGREVSDITKGDFLFFGKSVKEITHVAFAITPVYMLEAGGNDTNGMIRLRSTSWRRDMVAVLRFT